MEADRRHPDPNKPILERITIMKTEVYFCNDRNLWFVSYDTAWKCGEFGGFETLDEAQTAEDEWWANRG